ncbi:MAG: type II toxin-antitoxin system VapC family toxin [Actinomycetota bacterium]
MIFIDSNVPMYLVGAEHPHKSDAARILDGLVAKGERLVTDAEVLQEILHRYAAIDRLDAIQPAFNAVIELVDDVISISHETVEEAKEILLSRYGISARDAIHIAVMKTNEISRIASFDSGFDLVPGIKRIS